MSARALLATVLLLAAAPAQAPTVRTVLANGPTSNRYDLVILGDGYTAAQQATFDQDAQTFLTALFQKEPYRTFGGFFNAHTVFRPSTQPGANHPDATPPIVNNPVYGSSYNTGGTGRCLYLTNASLALADAALAPATEGRVIVIVNDARYGGCAGQFAVSYNGSLMAEVQIHEVGHALGRLADEYDYPNGTYTGNEPVEPNVTTSSSGAKWAHWHGTGGVGAFEGARYYRYGMWRPRSNCLMRDLGNPLCAVCQEQITRVLHGTVSAIDQPSPAAALTLGPTAQQPFAFTNLVPAANNPRITWRLDGQVVAGATATTWTLDTAPLTLGAHTVQVTVEDRTAIVRQDPNGWLVDRFTWNVTVVDPTAPDLRCSAVTPLTWFAPAGGSIPITTTVSNDGPGSSPAFAVDHFLSADTILDAADLWLGGYTVPGLAAQQSHTQQRQADVPPFLPVTPHYVLVVVDRGNAVRENDETNNQRLAVLLTQAPGCTPTLSYRDPLLYPRDLGSVPIGTGGTLLPTVVAPCAAPGTAYLIAWSCSGTTPGTTLAPGVTVPLNQDLCTNLGLALLNGAIFQQFWGSLDAQGIGRATFAWPAGLGIQPLNSHFAAVLLDATPAFVGATNAVRMDLR